MDLNILTIVAIVLAGVIILAFIIVNALTKAGRRLADNIADVLIDVRTDLGSIYAMLSTELERVNHELTVLEVEMRATAQLKELEHRHNALWNQYQALSDKHLDLTEELARIQSLQQLRSF